MREDSAWNAHLAVAACDWMREKCPRSYSLRIHWKLSNEAGRSWNWSGLWPNFLLHETSASRLSLMYSTWLCLRDCITWPPCCLLIERHFQPVQGNAMLLLPKLITQCAPKIETIAVQRQCCLRAVLQPGLLVFQLRSVVFASCDSKTKEREKTGNVMQDNVEGPAALHVRSSILFGPSNHWLGFGDHLKPCRAALRDICPKKGRISWCGCCIYSKFRLTPSSQREREMDVHWMSSVLWFFSDLWTTFKNCLSPLKFSQPR